MKTKTNRLVDSCGRISIPGYLRELIGLKFGDTVTVEVEADNSIRIRAAEEVCCICSEKPEGSELLEVPIGPNKHKFCAHCARAIVARWKE